VITRVNAKAVPVAGGLLNTNVVFSDNVTEKFVPVAKSSVVVAPVVLATYVSWYVVALIEPVTTGFVEGRYPNVPRS
tara:strand:- start:1859 stop:2089 length:231 start_codon:yes stop_codon:yes gene_type:complete